MRQPRRAAHSDQEHRGGAEAEQGAIVNCNQCEMLSINGIPCHETGCPNSRKTWIEARGEWVLFLKCFHCGCDIEDGDTCGCNEFDYCTECQAELESGQIGLCDDCQETEDDDERD
jgi:hypothetical protein